MYLVTFVTAPSMEVGKKIARKILEMKLAACVNINQEVTSLYWWEDEIQEDKECLLIIKTKMGLFTDMARVVRKLHPYSVPEIIALPIITGHKQYLDWISSETIPSHDDPGPGSSVF